MSVDLMNGAATPTGAARDVRHERALACVADILAAVNAARLDRAELHEVTAAMTTADRRRITDAATTWDEQEETEDGVSAIVARLLDELVATGRAIQRDGGYVGVEEEAAASRMVGLTTSRRQKTLAIAERTVAHLGRAVRACDLAEYMREYLPQSVAEYEPLLTILARDLQNLGTTGELIAVGRVRGVRTDGVVLYLPARLEPRREEFLPKSPLTWLDYVLTVIAALWSKRVVDAGRSGSQPRPITTKEVRAQLRADVDGEGRAIAMSMWGQDLDAPMTVQLALDTLAKGSTPAIRAVPDRTALWIPADVELKTVALDAAFGTDADRVVEATRRAMARLAVPAVSPAEVEEEISLDDALALSKATSAARVLSDLSKATVDDGAGHRRPRRVRRIHRVGRKGGANLYCAVALMPLEGATECAELEDAQRFAASERVLRDVASLDVGARLSALGHVRSPMIALGRARLLVAELNSIIPEVERTAQEGNEPARAILGQLVRAREDAMGWTRFRASLAAGVPEDVAQTAQTLTPAELQALFAPVSPTAAALPDAGAVVRQYARLIKRVANPEYVSQRSGDPRTAQRYLFDAVAARCYGVRLWGGPQARLAALMVEDELGELRDGRYLLPALAVENLEQRLRAVAAIAFLQPDGGQEALRRRARNDADPGVRELAIWALGFCGATDADAIAREAATEDPSEHVRRAARRFVDAGPGWGWHT